MPQDQHVYLCTVLLGGMVVAITFHSRVIVTCDQLAKGSRPQQLGRLFLKGTSEHYIIILAVLG